jgi:hypothetical protein
MKELIRHILREHTREIGEALKYTDDDLAELAKKYATLKDFRENNGGAYKTAVNRGILNDITKHMPRVKIWSYDEAKKDAEQYDTFADFQKNSPAFNQSYKNKWTDDFKQFLKLKKGEWEKKTKEMVMSDVAKSVNKNDFRSKFPLSYKAARERGWYDEVTEPLINIIDDRTRLIYAYEFPDNSVYVGLTVNEKRRKSGHLNTDDIDSPVAQHIMDTGLEPIYKVIVKDLTPKEAQESEGCVEEKYKSEGWKVLNRYKTGSLGACRRFWSEQSIYDAAKPFKTSSEFKKGNYAAYQAAQKYGYLKDITSKMIPVNTTIWDYEKSKELAKNYKTRSQFKSANFQAWRNSLQNGWLDEFFPIKLKNQFDKRK